MSNDPYPSPNAPYTAPQPAGIPVQQPSAPFSTPSAGGRKTGLLLLGVILLIAGVGGGVAAMLASGSAYDEAVENLARAPVGCTTELEFDKSGTFTIYVETKGSTGDPGGDCPNNDEDFEREDEDLPDVDLTLVNEDGDDVDIEDDEGKSYDAAGSAGESIGTVEIDEPGEYMLTVSSDDDDFAIAVGKNPKDAESLKTISYGLIGAGVVLGAVLIFLGLRKRPAAGGGGGGAPVTHYPQQQPPAAYTPTGVHAPASPPAGGFGPPPAAPPTQPMPAPQWQPPQQQ